MSTIEIKTKKRIRRTKFEMTHLRDSLFALAEAHQPLTVRQLFYRAVVANLIDKTQTDYNNVVVRLSGELREEGRLPFSWLVDNGRWMRKPDTYSSLKQMLRYTRQTYRRALWDEQRVYVEVWCESDSIAGVLYPVTQEWDVPLMPCGGQPSKSFVWSAANCMRDENRPCFVYYFGDYDKSGLDISDRIERDLLRYLPDDFNLSFERVAINSDQIIEFNLPTRPPKEVRGKEPKNVVTETVELEAMMPEDLRQLCRDVIEQHIDQQRLEKTKAIEEAERETLGQMFMDLDR